MTSPTTASTDERPPQLQRIDLATMTTEQIEEARRAGRLDDLLNGRVTATCPNCSHQFDPRSR